MTIIIHRISCSFCSKFSHEVEYMIQHDNLQVAICESCIKICAEQIERHRKTGEIENFRVTKEEEK